MSDGNNDISWALKLLENNEEPNFLVKYWFHIGGTIFGAYVPAAANFWLRRPLWAGIHRHIICAPIGLAVGHLISLRERFVLAQRDAIYRDYIRLHPEDFPPPDRKKWADLLRPWQPIR